MPQTKKFQSGWDNGWDTDVTKIKYADSSLSIELGAWDYDVNDDDTATITGYSGNSTNVVIPNYIGGWKVKRIGKNKEDSIWDDAIRDNSAVWIGSTSIKVQKTIKRITILSGIEEIGEWAFGGTVGVENISIPSSVTSIGKYAFFACSSLKNIIVPSSVTSIGNGAFMECSNLKDITIPSSVTTIGRSIFWEIPSITVTVPYKSGENPPDGWDSEWNSTPSDSCEVKIKYQ